MMGRSHALSGLLTGCGLVAVVPAPWPVEALAVAVCGGAALLPDLDHQSSTVARSLGPVTGWLARGVAAVSIAVYHATRCDGDRKDRASGHRTLTHTVPACVVFGVVTVVTTASAWPAAVTCGLLVALLAGGVRVAGTALAVTGAVTAYWTVGAHPGWSTLYGAAVAVGALSHIAGDACTNSGVPLWWPLVIDGQRWHRVTTPATFSTGDHLETNVVTPLLALGVAVAGAAVTGVLSAVATAISAGVAG